MERGFSQLKILKSDIRSTLPEERLNDLLAVKLLSADIQNFDPLPAIELWSTSCVRTRRPLLKDRASQRESSTAVVNVAADNTVVPMQHLCYLIQKKHPQLQWHTPQSNSFHAEIIGCTDDDEERDSGVDDDSDLEEEFVDRLIQKYL